jgi:hypothetical protein
VLLGEQQIHHGCGILLSLLTLLMALSFMKVQNSLPSKCDTLSLGIIFCTLCAAVRSKLPEKKTQHGSVSLLCLINYITHMTWLEIATILSYSYVHQQPTISHEAQKHGVHRIGLGCVCACCD